MSATTTAATTLQRWFTTAAEMLANATLQAANETSTLKQFSTPDYVIFAISLAIPLVIGVFFFLWDLKKSSTQNFLMGERSINFVAVALSILASLINGIFVIGIPAEIHYYGTRMTLMIVGLFGCIVIVSHVYAARYQSMKFTSAYEYVERRYNYATRVVASLIFCLSVIIFLAVVLYVPALSFAQVTGLSMYITIIVTGAICTIYTTIGGMKAVVWTDAIQMVILLVGLIVIAALGSQKAGGGQKVWDIAMSTGRINFDNYSADPRTRHTLWSQIFGQFVVYFGLFISNQMMVQRYMAVATARQAQATLYITFIMFIPLVILILFIGLALHAAYYNCDPLLQGVIKTGDQIMPYYIIDLLGDYQGVPGLLTASVFAAALSSVSAVCNSLAAVCLEDFIIPGWTHCKKKELPERAKRWLAVALVILFGLVTIGLSFLASRFTSKLIQATGTIWGVLGGPLGGIFVMGFFMPFVNSAGAICGMIGGITFALWVSIGSIVYSTTPKTLSIMPANWSTCPLSDARRRELVYQQINAPTPETFPLMDLYNVSYAWYGVIGMGSCILIGVVVSLATCWFEKCKPILDRQLMCLCCCGSCVFKDRNTHEFADKEIMSAFESSDVTLVVVNGNGCTASSEASNVYCDLNGVGASRPTANGITRTSKENDPKSEPPSYENIAFEDDRIMCSTFM